MQMHNKILMQKKTIDGLLIVKCLRKENKRSEKKKVTIDYFLI